MKRCNSINKSTRQFNQEVKAKIKRKKQTLKKYIQTKIEEGKQEYNSRRRILQNNQK